jgi:hypothetical protein
MSPPYEFSVERSEWNRVSTDPTRNEKHLKAFIPQRIASH